MDVETILTLSPVKATNVEKAVAVFDSEYFGDGIRVILDKGQLPNMLPRHSGLLEVVPGGSGSGVHYESQGEIAFASFLSCQMADAGFGYLSDGCHKANVAQLSNQSFSK
jgi:hypothetical protein